jgi:hypothetical protein
MRWKEHEWRYGVELTGTVEEVPDNSAGTFSETQRLCGQSSKFSSIQYPRSQT